MHRTVENMNKKLSDAIDTYPKKFDKNRKHYLGVFKGEGVGGEVVPVAMELLEVLIEHSSREFVIDYGGLIGESAKKLHGDSLTQETIDFAKKIFSQQGALFCGPGGERFVYKLRKEFDLFCKFTPLQPHKELSSAGVIRSNILDDIDIIAVRENAGGIYQGTWNREIENDEEIATHSFSYTKSMIEDILSVAMTLAQKRKKRLHVILKPGGIPTITDLWSECAKRMAKEFDIELIEFEIDNAAYQLIANPAQFDVFVSPNMFGDVLADCGSLLLASRGMSYSGNFNKRGNAVYQTGHGSAKDIAGKNIANPSAQILSLAMMLRESFCWNEAAEALKEALTMTFQEKICTSDVAFEGAKVVGTKEFGLHVKKNLQEYLKNKTI